MRNAHGVYLIPCGSKFRTSFLHGHSREANKAKQENDTGLIDNEISGAKGISASARLNKMILLQSGYGVPLNPLSALPQRLVLFPLSIKHEMCVTNLSLERFDLTFSGRIRSFLLWGRRQRP